MPQQILDAIRNNPANNAISLAGGLLTICPWLLTAPMLGALGFGAAGPVAGKYVETIEKDYPY